MSAKVHRPIDAQGEYQKIGPGVWRKWNPVLGLYTTLTVEYDAKGNRKAFHVKHEHPAKVLEAIIDRNVAMQNSWKGSYRGDLVTQTTSLPIAVHSQIMKQCGYEQGQGYDEKRFKQIINSRENYKLKTVPGNI